jgi:hypothetical protein
MTLKEQEYSISPIVKPEQLSEADLNRLIPEMQTFPAAYEKRWRL